MEQRRNIKILVVCGGSGRGLLGQSEALGFDAEVQIDVREELVQAPARDRLYQIAIDHDLSTQRIILGNIKRAVENLPAGPTKRHAEALVRYFPEVNRPVDKGLAKSPALGGGAVLSQEDRIRTTFESLIRNVGANLGPETGLDVWIVSSSAGGTGAGIRRKVGYLIAEVLEPRRATVNLHFLTFGSLTYTSVGGYTDLNTFFCVAADAAFAQIISRKYERVVPTFYYLDIPDVGAGETGRKLREPLAAMVAKAILLEQLQEAFGWILVDSHNRSVFARVGFWGGDFAQDRIMRVCLKSLYQQLDELCNPNLQSLIANKTAQLQLDPNLEWAMDYVRNVDNLMDKAQYIPKRRLPGRRIRQEDIERLEDALSKILSELPREFGLEALKCDFRIASVEEEHSLSLEELREGAPWPEHYRLIKQANEVWAWCDWLLGEYKQQREERASEILKTWGGLISTEGTREKLAKIATPLQDFLKLTVAIRRLEKLRDDAKRRLAALVPRVRVVTETVKSWLDSYGHESEEVELILTAQIDEVLGGVGRRTWFEIVERAVSLGDRAGFEEAVKQGAQGLTLAGLCHVLGLPVDTKDYSIIHDKVVSTFGALQVWGKTEEGRWWRADNIANLAIECYGFRLFSKLDDETAQGLQIRERAEEEKVGREIQFLSAPNIRALGAHVLALEMAIVGKDETKSTVILLRPLAEFVRRELNNGWENIEIDKWPQAGGDHGLRNISLAAVVGDPLYRPALEQLGFTEEEMKKLEYLFEMYVPSSGE